MAESQIQQRSYNLRSFVRVQYGRGSYMPVLIKMIEATSGPVLELGCGYVSTPYLHWSCFSSGRPVTSYESNKDWFAFASRFGRGHHDVQFVEDWDRVDLGKPWELAFVDHAPDGRRHIDVVRLAHVDYVVVHDTNNRDQRKYNFGKAFRHFRYRYKYTKVNPFTSVLSNKHDLRWLEDL